MAKRHKSVETSVAVRVQDEYAIFKRPVEEMKEVMAANLGGQGFSAFDLDRIKVPGGGGTFWTINTLEGEEQARAVEGIILHWRDVRRYYRQGLEETGGGSPPDCYSDDCVNGIGLPGGPCVQCPKAQWGSDPKGSKGQACKVRRMLFVLRPGSTLPDLIDVPTGSLQNCKKYFQRLAAACIPYYAVVTRLTLAPMKNDRGVPYAEIQFAKAADLEAEPAGAIRKLRESVCAPLDRVRVELPGPRGGQVDTPSQEP